MWEQIINFLSVWTFEGVTFAVFMLVFVVLIIKLHNNKNSKFLIDSLFVDDNGRASTSKMGELIALIVSTWAVVHLVIQNNITAEFFGAYMAAWVVNRGFRHYINHKYGNGVDSEHGPSYNIEEPAPEERRRRSTK